MGLPSPKAYLCGWMPNIQCMGQFHFHLRALHKAKSSGVQEVIKFVYCLRTLEHGQKRNEYSYHKHIHNSLIIFIRTLGNY